MLDDGYQYWDLQGRRHDVVLIDRQQPFGNEHLLPRGTLREPPSHLARAHTIFITKSDGNTKALRERITALNPTAAIIECVHQPMYFEDVFTGERKGLDLLAGKKVASLSGIAQPESFEQSLVKLGGELVYTKRFADHHRFTQQEILNAINRAKKRQADIIVTTQKDAVRFPKIDRRDLPFYFMRVEIKIVGRRERLPGLRPQNLLQMKPRWHVPREPFDLTKFAGGCRRLIFMDALALYWPGRGDPGAAAAGGWRGWAGAWAGSPFA